MSAMKKGLGRGFESLIPTDLIDDSFDPTAQQDERVSEFRILPIARIEADPDQPRRTFEEEALQELAASIKEHGVIQPIIVTRKGDHYQIAAGERRYRAATIAGLSEIPAIIRTLTDQNRLELSLIENLQRRDLNVIETATAYAKLRDQFNLTNEAIGERVHKSPSAVNNTMRLLKLPREVQYLVAEGELSEGQVRPLIAWDPDFVLKLVPRIIADGWSARRVERYLASLKNGEKPVATVRSAVAYDEQATRLKDRLQTAVTIKASPTGGGKITISFKDQADLDRIQTLLDN